MSWNHRKLLRGFTELACISLSLCLLANFCSVECSILDRPNLCSGSRKIQDYRDAFGPIVKSWPSHWICLPNCTCSYSWESGPVVNCSWSPAPANAPNLDQGLLTIINSMLQVRLLMFQKLDLNAESMTKNPNISESLLIPQGSDFLVQMVMAPLFSGLNISNEIGINTPFSEMFRFVNIYINSHTDLTYLDLTGKNPSPALWPFTPVPVTTQLGPRWFVGYNRTRRLCLQETKLTMIHYEAFIGLDQLEILDLSQNSITRLSDNVFKSLRKLAYLDLSTNLLQQTISETTFLNPLNLIVLNVSRNQLSHFPSTFSGKDSPILKSLRYLYASENIITISGLEPPFENLESLELNTAIIDVTSSDSGPFEKYSHVKALSLRNISILLQPDGIRLVHRQNAEMQHCIPQNSSHTDPVDTAKHFQSRKYCNFCGWLVDFSATFGTCATMFHQLEILSNTSNQKGSLLSITLDQAFTFVSTFGSGQISIFQRINKLEELDLTSAKGLVLHDDTFRNSTMIKKLILNDLHIDNNTCLRTVLEPLVNIKSLHLSGNSIHSVNASFLPNRMWTQLDEIDLSYNPFHCDCDIVWFLNWLKTTNVVVLKINDSSAYKCYTPLQKQGLYIRTVDLSICSRQQDYILLVLLLSLGTFFILSFLASFLHKFRWHVKYWQFQLQSANRQYGETRDQNEFKYDAFVMYSNEDSEWVTKNLVPQLEHNENESIRLCDHERDFNIGEPIVHNIVESIECSRKCLMIVSNAFLTSNWCNYEMRLAQSRSTTQASANTVLVFLEEIAPINMTPRLRLQKQRERYIEWTEEEIGQRLFWTRLRRALSKPQKSNVHELPLSRECIELEDTVH